MARAAEVFAGPTLTVEDDRQDYGEVRYITIGFLDEAMVVLVWTPCDDSNNTPPGDQRTTPAPSLYPTVIGRVYRRLPRSWTTQPSQVGSGRRTTMCRRDGERRNS